MQLTQTDGQDDSSMLCLRGYNYDALCRIRLACSDLISLCLCVVSKCVRQLYSLDPGNLVKKNLIKTFAHNYSGTPTCIQDEANGDNLWYRL